MFTGTSQALHLSMNFEYELTVNTTCTDKHFKVSLGSRGSEHQTEENFKCGKFNTEIPDLGL
jgi:hypothetical protein